jgi:hypothetical protein
VTLRIPPLILLPPEEHFLRRADGAIAHPLRIIPGEDDLNGGKESLVKHLLLVGQQLPDPITNRDTTAF